MLTVGQVLEQIADFALAVAAMAAQGANRGEFACLRPAGDRLWIDSKERGDLRWGEELLAFEGTLHAHRLRSGARCEKGIPGI